MGFGIDHPAGGGVGARRQIEFEPDTIVRGCERGEANPHRGNEFRRRRTGIERLEKAQVVI